MSSHVCEARYRYCVTEFRVGGPSIVEAQVQKRLHVKGMAYTQQSLPQDSSRARTCACRDADDHQ